jgi:hypothetical protein
MSVARARATLWIGIGLPFLFLFFMSSTECWGDVVAHVTACREKCQFWGTRRGCRKGNKCKLLHDDTNAERLPYISRNIDKNGVHHLALRPPIDPDALDLFFEGAKRPKTLHTSRQIKTPDRGVLLYFDFKRMVERDEVACVRSLSAGGVRDTSDVWRGSCNKKLPAYCMHATQVEGLLQIALDGAIRPSIKGTAGAGIYTFGVEDLSDESLVETYSRACTGGYGSAAIIMEMAGICIKK